jgi:hypothetical protein
LKQAAKPQWLILGDFDLVYKEDDKNQGRLNKRFMLSFGRAINHLEIRELNLMERKYTWRNNHSSPTLTRIDRDFCTTSWEDCYA